MLHASIHIELPKPAEVRARAEPGLWSRMRSLLGSGVSEVGGATVATWTVLSQLGSAFERVGVRDVVRVEIDGVQTYADPEERGDDLGDALRSTAAHPKARGALERMRVVFADIRGNVQTVFEVRVGDVANRLVVDMTARPVSLRPARGEQPRAYVERVQAAAVDGEFLDELRAQGLDLVASLAIAIGQHMPGAVVQRRPSRVELEIPDAAAIERFRLLGWGESVEAPRYLATPVLHAGADPDRFDGFERHYLDAYWPLTQWAILRAVLDRHALRQPGIEVRDVQGRVLFAVDQVEAFERTALERELGRVSLDERGHLHVEPAFEA